MSRTVAIDEALAAFAGVEGALAACPTPRTPLEDAAERLFRVLDGDELLARALRLVAPDAAAAALDEATGGLLAELGHDERRVLAVLVRRLHAGQRAYGLLDVRRDPRDWRRERADELADALVYGAIAEVAAATATATAIASPTARSIRASGCADDHEEPAL